MSTSRRKQYRHNALTRYAKYLGTQEIHTLTRNDIGLHAIIAIHSTARGPAIGGCRFHPYPSADFALKDVLRLSYGMTLKAAASELPHGGAKAVIIHPKKINNREEIFSVFGDFVNSLNGSYITAMDMGTTTKDMDSIAKQTPHVIGAAGQDSLQGDPSPYTALGVFRGIQAAVAFKLNKESLDGVRVSIQGAGKVAATLAQHLQEAGALVTITDINTDAVTQLTDTLHINSVSPEKIYQVPCDVFSPCAIGGTINQHFLQQCNASIIAGAANNQFSHRQLSDRLHEKGVLYAPDFVINAGGLIQAASIHDYRDINFANHLIEKMYHRMYGIFERAKKQNQPTMVIAEQIAQENLKHINHPVAEEVA